jgi:hypothetical protein
LFEQHLERTRTHPSATGASDITVETCNIGASGKVTLETCNIGSHSIGSHSIGSHSNITLEASGIGRYNINSNIRSRNIRTWSIRTANGAAVGLLGPGFSGGSVIEHVFDCTGGV